MQLVRIKFVKSPGVCSKKFYTGSFLVKVQPFTILYTIFQEDTPIVYRLLLTDVTPS